MSRIADLGPNLQNLPTILLEYYEDLELLEVRIKLGGKTILQAQKDQVDWFFHYDDKRIELRTIVKFIQQRLDKVRGELFQQSVENYTREISDRAREKYIDSHPTYIQLHELFLEVEEIYEKYVSAADAFRSRGFVLRDMTTVLTNSLQERTI